MDKLRFLQEVPFEQCWLEPNTIPIGTNWSDTNKGDVDKVVSRLRLVATEFKVHQVKMGILRDDVFSATPFFGSTATLAELDGDREPASPHEKAHVR